MVLVHGYAGLNCHWALCIKFLSKHFRLYLVELHGHGRSDRTPPFPEDLSAEAAEIYMADYIENWRLASDLGDEPFILVGHSLGGMIAWRYALMHRQRLRHLVLLSPVGVPFAPRDLDEKIESSSWFVRFICKKWRSGTSPMDVVRSFGPLGIPILKKVARKRLGWIPESSPVHRLDFDLFCDALHQSWALPANGERAMNAMLLPYAYAKLPLINRVVSNPNGPTVPEVSLPMSVIYGDSRYDWMDGGFGKEMCRLLRDRKGSQYVNFREVRDAGHTVPMDNPRQFCEILLEEMGNAGTVKRTL
jgi:pimeloyl-ACP methyl ester carboxylesterase